MAQRMYLKAWRSGGTDSDFSRIFGISEIHKGENTRSDCWGSRIGVEIGRSVSQWDNDTLSHIWSESNAKSVLFNCYLSWSLKVLTDDGAVIMHCLISYYTRGREHNG